MKSKEKICLHYISNFLPLTEIWIFNQIKYLKAFKPVVISRFRSNNGLFPFKPVHSLWEKGKLYFWFNIALSKITGFIPFFYLVGAKINVKVLHVHFGYSAIKLLGLKKILKVPLICSFYGTDAFRFPFIREKNREILHKLFKHADKILVLGPYMKNSLVNLGCQPNKIIIHHLGIETSKITYKNRTLPDNRPVKFLLASSFVEKKGIDICLKALSGLTESFKFEIDVIGDGVLRTKIEDLILQLNLQDKVRLHGYQSYEYLLEFAYKSDAFLQASKTSSQNDKEGTPMVLVDMMATGLPVITTNHSDIPEIVQDNVTGFLAKENDVDSFKNKILEFISNRSRISEISFNCRKKVENDFNAGIQSSKLEEIYNELIN